MFQRVYSLWRAISLSTLPNSLFFSGEINHSMQLENFFNSNRVKLVNYFIKLAFYLEARKYTGSRSGWVLMNLARWVNGQVRSNSTPKSDSINTLVELGSIRYRILSLALNAFREKIVCVPIISDPDSLILVFIERKSNENQSST